MANLPFTLKPAEKEKTKRNPSKNHALCFYFTEDEMNRINEYIKRHHYHTRADFVRDAIFKAMIQIEPQLAPAEWMDEPFTITEAAEKWNVHRNTISTAIMGSNRQKPRVMPHESKKVNSKRWIITRAGMERLFGKMSPQITRMKKYRNKEV